MKIVILFLFVIYLLNTKLLEKKIKQKLKYQSALTENTNQLLQQRKKNHSQKRQSKKQTKKKSQVKDSEQNSNNKSKNKKQKWTPPPRFVQMRIQPGPIAKEGWLRLASDSLGNMYRYPPIPQEDTKQPDVDLKQLSHKENKALPNFLQKKGNFRKNSQYCPESNIPTIDSFWFRLNGQNLYYTELKEDSVVLGSIQISNMVKSLQGFKGCFKIIDKEQDYWMLCSVDGKCNYEWQCAIDTLLNRPCTPCEEEEESILEIQPSIIIPIESPNCKYDWNYNIHGQNWVCNCNEGREQSPIDLPPKAVLELAPYNADFTYQNVSASDMEVVYEINLCRIRTLNNKIFGTLKDVDNTVYEAYEIQIHTPGEHTISQYQTDMEIQVIHRAVEGKMQNQAILSFLYRRTPGAIRKVFEVFDVLNLPNPVYNKGENVMKGDLNVNQFMFDDLFMNPPPFSYYKYKGSNTQPPCAENVVWFVVEKMQEVSSTILVMFRDVLNIPLQVSSSTNLNFDGSNRKIMPILDRKIYFYDPEKACFPVKTQLPPAEGHYEKITRKANKYFYITSLLPSGIQGAQVVNEKEAKSLPEDIWRETDRYNVGKNTPY